MKTLKNTDVLFKFSRITHNLGSYTIVKFKGIKSDSECAGKNKIGLRNVKLGKQNRNKDYFENIHRKRSLK